eukprot:jgi/Chrzof1/3103/Cz12g12040.t1
MVTAQQGALIECDTPAREYLISLNSKQTHNNKFILKELDDTHLWVKTDKVDYIKQAVKDFNNSNVYTPPAREDPMQHARH